MRSSERRPKPSPASKMAPVTINTKGSAKPCQSFLLLLMSYLAFDGRPIGPDIHWQIGEWRELTGEWRAAAGECRAGVRRPPRPPARAREHQRRPARSCR